MDRLYNSLRNQRFLQIHEIACILYDNKGVSGSPSETNTSEFLSRRTKVTRENEI